MSELSVNTAKHNYGSVESSQKHGGDKNGSIWKKMLNSGKTYGTASHSKNGNPSSSRQEQLQLICPEGTVATGHLAQIPASSELNSIDNEINAQTAKSFIDCYSQQEKFFQHLNSTYEVLETAGGGSSVEHIGVTLENDLTDASRTDNTSESQLIPPFDDTSEFEWQRRRITLGIHANKPALWLRDYSLDEHAQIQLLNDTLASVKDKNVCNIFINGQLHWSRSQNFKKET